MSSKARASSSSMDVDLSESGKSKKKVSWTEKESPKVPKEVSVKKSATESFTDLFWHMANVHPQVRLQATKTLVETLLNLEKEGKKTVQTKNGFTNISDELDYTLSRLAKGLLSNRDAARQGFATALSEVLRYLNIDLKEASDLIIAEVINARSNPDVRPKERRIGFLFAVGAFVRSGRLPSALNKPATQNATLTFVVHFLKELSSSESLKQLQMLELTIETILELLSQVPKTHFQSHIHPIFSKILSVPSDGLQPELISLALGLQKMFGYSLSTDNPQLWNKSETIFGAKNIRNLALPLNVTVRTVPRVHKVWDHLIEALLVPSASQSADLQRFGSVILDSLLKSDSTDHVYMAFQVATQCLKSVDSTLVEAILTPELLNALFVTISKTKSVLFEAAKKLVLTAIEQGKKSTEMAISILRRLSGPYGDLTTLDHHVKPAIVHTLVQTLDEKALAEYATIIFKQLVSAEAPADLVTRTEVVSTFEPSSSSEAPSKSKSSKSKSGKNDVDMDVDDSDEDVPAPNQQVELREVRINPETWKKSRQESLAQHLMKLAMWTQTEHVNVARKVLNTLYLLAFYNTRSGDAVIPSKTPKKSKSSKSLLKPVAESVFLLEKVEIDDSFSKYLANLLLNLIDALKVPKPETSSDASNSEQKKSTRHSRHVDTTPFDHAHFWILPLVQFEKSLLDDSADFEPRLHGNELDDIRSTAEALMAKIEPVLKVSDQTRRVRLEAFQALLIHLHVLINVDLEDSIQSIKDLSQVFEELFIENDSKKSKSKTPTKSSSGSKSKSSNDMDVEQKPEAIEVFVEILIALLMKAHRTLKSTIEQNWVAFASLVSDRAFEILLNALEEEQSAEGDDDDDDDDILEIGEDDSSLEDLNDDELAELGLASGKKSEGGKKKEAHSDSEDSEEDDASSEDGKSGVGSSDEEDEELEASSSESEESDEALDEMARQKFKAVLQAAGAYAGSDDEDDEDVDFTDEKMFEIDMGLAKVVKELQAAKNASKRTRDHKMTPLEIQASEFRMRLLALVDLYVDHQTGHHNHHLEEENAKTSQTPSKSPKSSKSSDASHSLHASPYHTIYLNAIWPLVRIVDVISQRKSMKPLLTRVLASIHRLCKSKPSESISEKQIDTLYGILSHCYAGFNQPSKPQQVDMRLTLIMFLQKILSDEKNPKFKKMREGFHTALKAYADSSPTSIKSRSLYIDIYAQIIRRSPQLHLPLLSGISDILSSSKEGPHRQTLAISLFGTLTRGIVESDIANHELQRAHNIPTVEFSALIKEFIPLFKILFTDPKGKPIHKKDLLILAIDLFKILLALNKGDLAATQATFDTKNLLKFTSSHLASNALPILTAAHETFISHLQTGKGKTTTPKYASVEEKYAAKRQRKLERQEKQKERSKQMAQKAKQSSESTDTKSSKKEKVAAKSKASDSAPLSKKTAQSSKMDLSESIELETPKKDKKRKEPEPRSLDESASSTTKRAAKKSKSQ